MVVFPAYCYGCGRNSDFVCMKGTQDPKCKYCGQSPVIKEEIGTDLMIKGKEVKWLIINDVPFSEQYLINQDKRRQAGKQPKSRTKYSSMLFADLDR